MDLGLSSKLSSTALDHIADAAASSLEGARTPGREADAADAFEKVFATMLVKEMRRSLPGGFFGKGQGADVFESWLDEHLGASLAKDDVLGVAAMIRIGLESKQGPQNAAEGDSEGSAR